MRHSAGLTLLELLITLSVLGILLGIGGTTVRSDRIAVDQAARALSMQVSRARLEALRRNDTVGLNASTAAQQVRLFTDLDRNSTYAAGELLRGTTIQYGADQQSHVKLNSDITLLFDARGILRSPMGATITLSSHRGYQKTIAINAQGKVAIQ